MAETRKIVKSVPFALVTARLLLGFVLLGDALDGSTGAWFAPGLVAGLLSDVYDGVLARRLGVSSQRLRVADSWVDSAFFVCVAASAWLAQRAVILAFAVPLLWMLAAYAVSLIVPWLKYGRMPAYHAYSAKASGALLFLAGLELFGWSRGGWLLWAAIGVSILSHVERTAITLILPKWTHDVAGVWRALALRREQM